MAQSGTGYQGFREAPRPWRGSQPGARAGRGKESQRSRDFPVRRDGRARPRLRRGPQDPRRTARRATRSDPDATTGENRECADREIEHFLGVTLDPTAGEKILPVFQRFSHLASEFQGESGTYCQRSGCLYNDGRANPPRWFTGHKSMAGGGKANPVNCDPRCGDGSRFPVQRSLWETGPWPRPSHWSFTPPESVV